MAAVKRGVTIVLVPLVGLSCDQVENAGVPAHNVKAYHVDKFRGANTALLKEKILLMNEKDMSFVSIIFIMGPSLLSYFLRVGKGGWLGIVHTLAECSHMSRVYIDKAHSVE